jgi:transposase
MGRSRGGLTTKIHALVDAHGLPIALKLTAGQAHDGRSATDMLGSLGPGDILLADRAYDSDALRIEMEARGAWANIPSMPNRKRRPAFSAFLYRYRNLVERFFAKLKQFRAIATRYDKRDDNFLASRRKCGRHPQSNSPQSGYGCDIMSRRPRAVCDPIESDRPL